MDQSDEMLAQRAIGGVNPLYARMGDDDTKRDLIKSTSPFQRGNQVVLVPVFFEAHWSGVVFDFTNSKLVFFDPMQTNKNYGAMEKIVNEFFGEHVSGLEQIRQRAPRQQDTNSFGPLTLLFFECMAHGIPVPNAPPESIPYIRFRYMFLASKGAFCQNHDDDTATSEDES